MKALDNVFVPERVYDYLTYFNNRDSFKIILSLSDRSNLYSLSYEEIVTLFNSAVIKDLMLIREIKAI